jgi:hypothetical protein
VAWGLKALAISAAGGLGLSPVEDPLFILGLVAIVVSFASLGVAVAHGRSRAAQVAGAVVGLVIGVALSALASAVAAAVIPESAGWVQGEAGLWFSAALALVATVVWRSRGRVPHTSG